MFPPEEIHIRCDDGRVYYCADIADDIWTGYMSDDDSISERQIRAYIEDENPILFRRIHGMPFASTDIPLSYHGHRTLRNAETRNPLLRWIKRKQDHHQQRPTSFSNSPPSIDTTILPTFTGTKLALQNANGLLQLQIKRQIQKCLNSGYVLFLRRLPVECTRLSCSASTCLFGDSVDTADLYLILKGAESLTEDLLKIDRDVTFHLECMESMFDGPRTSPQTDTSAPITLGLFDGVGRKTIIQAASRFFTDDESREEKQDSSTSEYLTLSQSTNSQHARESRRKRGQEIEEVLQEVARYEISRTVSRKSSRNSSPDLLITRMPYIEKPEERYKKQGLQAKDLRQANMEEAETRRALSFSSALEEERTLANIIGGRHCYCREFDDGNLEMIHCSSSNCPIGWFHLKCTGLLRLPIVGDKFYCEYCRDDFGPFKPLVRNSSDKSLSIDASSLSLNESESSKGDVQMMDDYHEGSDLEYDGDSEGGLESEEEDRDDTLTVSKPASAPWGTPINSPSVDRIVERVELIKEPVSPSPMHGRKRDFTKFSQIDGFPPMIPVNDEIPLDDLQSEVGAFDSTPHTEPLVMFAHSPPSYSEDLLPAPSNVPFRSLAPFIFVDGLTEKECKVFDDWKTKCVEGPMLVSKREHHDAMARNDPGLRSGRSTYVIGGAERLGGTGTNEENGVKRLSKLLNEVRIDV